MTDENAAMQPLSVLRERVEAVDRRVIQLLAERVELAREIGRRKRAAGLPTLDPAREIEVVSRAVGEARTVGLDPETVRDIAWRLVGLSRRAQQDEQSTVKPAS